MSTHGGTGGGGGSAAILASVQYAPAVEVALSVTTLAVFDATNLTIAFTTATTDKGSTAVIVRLTGCVQNNAGKAYWALLDHTAMTQVGLTATVQDGIGSSIEAISVAIIVTGLTPNTAYQYDWAGIGVGAATILYVQGATGAPSTPYAGLATMEVLAA